MGVWRAERIMQCDQAGRGVSVDTKRPVSMNAAAQPLVLEAAVAEALAPHLMGSGSGCSSQM